MCPLLKKMGGPQNGEDETANRFCKSRNHVRKSGSFRRCSCRWVIWGNHFKVYKVFPRCIGVSGFTIHNVCELCKCIALMICICYCMCPRCMRAESCKRLNQSMERNIENCRMQHISLMTHELCFYVSESLITNVVANFPWVCFQVHHWCGLHRHCWGKCCMFWWDVCRCWFSHVKGKPAMFLGFNLQSLYSYIYFVCSHNLGGNQRAFL